MEEAVDNKRLSTGREDADQSNDQADHVANAENGFSSKPEANAAPEMQLKLSWYLHILYETIEAQTSRIISNQIKSNQIIFSCSWSYYA